MMSVCIHTVGTKTFVHRTMDWEKTNIIVILYYGHNNDVVAALMLYTSLRRTDVCYIVARLMFVYGGVT